MASLSDRRSTSLFRMAFVILMLMRARSLACLSCVSNIGAIPSCLSFLMSSDSAYCYCMCTRVQAAESGASGFTAVQLALCLLHGRVCTAMVCVHNTKHSCTWSTHCHTLVTHSLHQHCASDTALLGCNTCSRAARIESAQWLALLNSISTLTVFKFI
jgi:hypothetical protein